ncbi:hypothetical protein PIB30_049036 [Stylosanthes scabra]|uniref:Uncharacterized protein n=1 Tax=Stylosanthes scabra TaxID=79078 RepID=A0ABU6TH30_9FABA|nr:hypothetical protein [Stylosanthes scabra]
MANPNPNEVAIKVKALLEKGQPRFSKECRIYRVPHEIRKHNEDAYTPNVVSIGPFHHGNQNLLNMEGQKRLYCRKFIENSQTKNMVSFVSCVQEMEEEVRGCYSEDIKLSKEELVILILVDCCFMLQFLLEFFLMTKEVITLSLPRRFIQIDIVLAVPAVAILPDKTINSNNLEKTLTAAHYTDLFRKLLLSSSQIFTPSECSREGKLQNLYSVTDLKELGVKFKVNKDSKCLLDLELSRSLRIPFIRVEELSRYTLRIPFIRVDDSTEVLWRNLLAFEQCHCIHEAYFTDYITFLDFLINTDKDVDLLIKEGIIENWLGDSNAVVKMFNGLGVDILKPDFNVKYSLIFKRLNAFCKRRWIKKYATLKRDYCNTTWQKLASLAAILLLILTSIQTVFSVLQCFSD